MGRMVLDRRKALGSATLLGTGGVLVGDEMASHLDVQRIEQAGTDRPHHPNHDVTFR
ncbi:MULTISPECIES: hypothetical protein [Sorangium]|uniref:hypothetical protein n=1 Tax=Sorangium TaxID=39643 RepID=UPI003D9C4D48